MTKVEARLISKSADGRRAEVVVALDGSTTCHIRLEGTRWMADNPDKPAVARMKQAENLLASATLDYERLQPLAEISLESIKKMRAEFRLEGRHNAVLPEEFQDLRGALFGWAQRRTISDMKARIKRSVAGSAAALKNAGDHFKEVKVPERVQFIF